ncbi:MAG: tetratricopeptide repeat protein [Armatimonadota bacterium]|jgi:hypothetical protein
MRSLCLLIVTAVIVAGCTQNAEDVQPPNIPAAHTAPVSQPRVAGPQQDNPTKQARAAIRYGRTLYNDGRYAEARTEFVKARQLGLYSADTWIAACDERRAPQRQVRVTSTRPAQPTPNYGFQSTGDVDKDLDLINHDLDQIQRELDFIDYQLHGPPPTVRIVE